MKRLYRGITNVVRRGIHSSDLRGKITLADVRCLLPEQKQDAPDRTIQASLNRMARNNEIQRVHGDFYTKDIKKSSIKEATTSTASAPNEAVVKGKLLGTKTENGKIIATVEVTSLQC
jgi:hypothetical protein